MKKIIYVDGKRHPHDESIFIDLDGYEFTAYVHSDSAERLSGKSIVVDVFSDEGLFKRSVHSETGKIEKRPSPYSYGEVSVINLTPV